jgi:hypothetical protein
MTMIKRTLWTLPALVTALAAATAWGQTPQTQGSSGARAQGSRVARPSMLFSPSPSTPGAASRVIR